MCIGTNTWLVVDTWPSHASSHNVSNMVTTWSIFREKNEQHVEIWQYRPTFPTELVPKIAKQSQTWGKRFYRNDCDLNTTREDDIRFGHSSSHLRFFLCPNFSLSVSPLQTGTTTTHIETAIQHFTYNTEQLIVDGITSCLQCTGAISKNYLLWWQHKMLWEVLQWKQKFSCQANWGVWHHRSLESHWPK